jgi:hypothetical protein
MVNSSITLADYEQAEADIRAAEGRNGVAVHAAIYILVNALLLLVNLVVVPGFLWFFFPLIGWGIGLTMHYLFAVRFAASGTAEWQARVEHRASALHAQPVR